MSNRRTVSTALLILAACMAATLMAGNAALFRSSSFYKSTFSSTMIITLDDTSKDVPTSPPYDAPEEEEDEAPSMRLKPGEKFSVVSRRQAKRGYDSMVFQLTKPLRCVEKSRWRGPDLRSDSVETRLDYAFAMYKFWEENATRAVVACGNGIPMMDPGEFGLLFHLLRKGDLMLEWGSGRSSCVWAQVVGELHSIDDSSTWVNMFMRYLNVTTNQMIHWMPSFAAAETYRPMSSLDQYHMYMNVPFFIAPTCFAKYNNVKFDVILVDGRVRPQCAYQALLLLKRNGVLIMHDFESNIGLHRPYYRIVLRWYELLHREGRLGIFRIRPEKTGPDHYKTPQTFPTWWVKTYPDREVFNLADPNKMTYSEPFETPKEPTAEERAFIRAKWLEVRKNQNFSRTDDLFGRELYL